MADVLFVLAFFAPPVTVVLAVGAVALASTPRRVETSARAREQTAISR